MRIDVLTLFPAMFGGPFDETRMTHPAQWGERRRAILAESARAAGLPTPRLIVGTTPAFE